MNNNMKFDSEIGNYPIKIVALGGLNESGKNCYVIEVNNDAFVVEAGLKYPPLDKPGVELIVPDFDYIKSINWRIKGIFITHGHDDQYGALPYLLEYTQAPIFATETTISIIKSNYGSKFHMDKANFICVKPSQTLLVAGHSFELFQTSHSVAESFGFALKTPQGNIVYTSDFMTDYSAMKGFQLDLTKVVRIAEENKTFLLMTESEGANKPGIAAPNHKISAYLKDVLEEPTGKTFISIYHQNFYNIQEIFSVAHRYKKKICFANEEQIPFFEKMFKVGALNILPEMIIPVSDISITSAKDVIILITGSGEKLFNLVKDICYGSIQGIKVESNDTWVNCAPSVPGTEVIATDASDTVFRTDCHVKTLSRKEVSSMHAQQEDLKLMISLFRPKYYLPVKGDYRNLVDNASLAINLGIGLNHFNTFVYDNGMALAFDKDGNVIRKNILIKTGDVLIDKSETGEVKKESVEERQKMVNGGVIVLGLTISSKKKTIVSTPDVQMRGFLYLSESDPIINQISSLYVNTISNYLTTAQGKISLNEMEKKSAEKIGKFVFRTTDKDPTILCKLIDIDNIEILDPR